MKSLSNVVYEMTIIRLWIIMEIYVALNTIKKEMKLLDLLGTSCYFGHLMRLSVLFDYLQVHTNPQSDNNTFVTIRYFKLFFLFLFLHCCK